MARSRRTPWSSSPPGGDTDFDALVAALQSSGIRRAALESGDELEKQVLASGN